MYRLFILIIGFSMLAQIGAAQVDVKLEFKDYPNDTLIIGNYYADRQLVKDTLIREDDSKDFRLQADSSFHEGVYLAITIPDHQFIQFLMPADDQVFDMKIKYDDLADIKFDGSDENERFYDYLGFIRDNRPDAISLGEKIAAAEEDGKIDDKSTKKLAELDAKILAYQQELVANMQGTLTALLISGNFDVDIPDFEGEPESIKMLRFQYYRDHYFDNVDMDHAGLLRTPFIHERVMYYMQKLNSPMPDSTIVAIDRMLAKFDNNPRAHKFYTSFFLNQNAQMKMVGQDAVYVHMVDKYYSGDKAPWVKAETKAKIIDNANKLRPLLIGNKMPDITTYTKDSTAVRVLDIDAEYTVLIFWKPGCGHCTKAMPHVVKFNDDYAEKGIKTMSICTSGGKKYKKMWDDIDTKDMGRMINTGDEYTRFQRQVYVRKTPKVVVLDKNKEIVIKDIPAEKLSEVMDEIIRLDELEKATQE